MEVIFKSGIKKDINNNLAKILLKKKIVKKPVNKLKKIKENEKDNNIISNN